MQSQYGDYLITNLSRHLSDAFGKGFSEANLWNMKQFYPTFPDYEQFSTHRIGNLSWTNIRLIMRLDDPKQWKSSTNRKPLIIRGARQVGKTTLIRGGARSYAYTITLNLDNSFTKMRMMLWMLLSINL